MTLECTILNNLVNNEEFNRRALPYIVNEYFTTESNKVIFTMLQSFMMEYNKLPTKEALIIEVEQSNARESEHKEAIETISSFTEDCEEIEWLVDKTEKFCQDRAVYIAIMDSITIIDGRDKNRDKGAIPELLSSALSVSFNRAIGHNYFEQADERYDFYVKPEYKVPFDIDILNKITKGGFSKKTLNILIAGTGVGKSLAMCHMSAANLMDGKNVLYITLEMAEERIAERIDANLLNINLNDLVILPKDSYLKMINKIKTKTTGQLIVKEYPTASAHAGHFRHLLNELRLKKDFIPDIIYIDYINICTSSRLKVGIANSYIFVKFIAEELRGLAVEYNVPLVSATQLNREGLGASDVGLTETSESIGLPFTADFMMAIIQDEEMRDLGQFLCKQLKNRYNDMDYYSKFMIGVDKPKMRLFDLENTAQENISQSGKHDADDDTPLFDKGEIAMRFDKEKLKGFTV